jgi:hypothetical protein
MQIAIHGKKPASYVVGAHASVLKELRGSHRSIFELWAV